MIVQTLFRLYRFRSVLELVRIVGNQKWHKWLLVFYGSQCRRSNNIGRDNITFHEDDVMMILKFSDHGLSNKHLENAQRSMDVAYVGRLKGNLDMRSYEGIYTLGISDRNQTLINKMQPRVLLIIFRVEVRKNCVMCQTFFNSKKTDNDLGVPQMVGYIRMGSHREIWMPGVSSLLCNRKFATSHDLTECVLMIGVYERMHWYYAVIFISCGFVSWWMQHILISIGYWAADLCRCKWAGNSRAYSVRWNMEWDQPLTTGGQGLGTQC